MENDPVIPPLVGEDEEADSDPPDIEQELSDFRNQWKQELQTNSSQAVRKKTAEKTNVEAAILEQAKVLFVKGTQLEQSGCLYEAIEYYRRATQLVPDIEFRIDFSTIRSPRERTESESSVGSLDHDEEVEDLISHLRHVQIEEGVKTVCLPEYEQRATHISVLPVEVLLYIFKWVVSPDLDMKSLENISQVCRGFYLAARDEEIWRLACVRVWGVSTGKSRKYGGWRNMYIQRPHLHFNGCYISKVTYIRPGEKSLDSFYRPYHLVEYYRYVRFFPEGLVFMVTSSEEPLAALPKLKSRSVKDSGMLKGVYRLTGDRVVCVMKRVKTKDQTIPYYRKHQRRQPNQNESENTYHMEFEMLNVGQKSHVKLQWLQYTITTLYKATGQENHADMLDNGKSFPPLIFSRVKSYTTMSEEPLT